VGIEDIQVLAVKQCRQIGHQHGFEADAFAIDQRGQALGDDRHRRRDALRQLFALQTDALLQIHDRFRKGPAGLGISPRTDYKHAAR